MIFEMVLLTFSTKCKSVMNMLVYVSTCTCCGSILSLVQILVSFVSNSLSYITIPKNKRKIKFELRIKLNHNIHIDTCIYIPIFKWYYFINAHKQLLSFILFSSLFYIADLLSHPPSKLLEIF